FCPPSPVTYLSLFHPPPPTELYTLSLHDALPILGGVLSHVGTPDTKVKFGKYPMKIVEPGHPITQGASDFEHEDELYYYLQTQGEPIKPLVVAVYEGKEWPVLWTRNYGKGKVCVSVFGHCGVQAKAKDPLEHE